jgi:hypothetical protein
MKIAVTFMRRIMSIIIKAASHWSLANNQSIND